MVVRRQFITAANTTVAIELPEATHVGISVFDVLGRKVATLTDKVESSGRHSYNFDGAGLGAGIYLIDAVARPLNAPSHAIRETRQIVLTR